MAEDPTAGNRGIFALQLEQKQAAGLQRLELTLTRWLPEIDLVRSNAGKEFEPGLMRHADEDLDHATTMTACGRLAT